jgi:predicted transcriptional regulator
MAKLGFGELELSILKILQELGKATVRDVYKALGSEGSYTTIMTVMSRMAEKGELKREKDGKQYIYWLDSLKHSKTVLQRIQDRIFGGKGAEVVTYLLNIDQGISEQELEKIEKLIQEKRAEKKRG